MEVITQNKRPGTQSIFIPNPGTAHECVISSEQDINLKTVLVGKTSIPVERNNRRGSSTKTAFPEILSQVDKFGSTP
jgi:hypothetical protein